MASFDLTVEQPAGMIRRSVEVTTLEPPLRQTHDITNAVRHAADKIVSRQTAGQPIPGARDATIRVELDAKPRSRRGETRWIESNGDRMLATRDDRRISEGNIFDRIASHLSSNDHEAYRLLDRLTLADKKTGVVLAEYERTGNTWTRIR